MTITQNARNSVCIAFTFYFCITPCLLSAADGFVDNFSHPDPSNPDRIPVTWTVNELSDGTFDIIDGTYVATGNSSQIKNEEIFSEVRDIVYSDVSVQAQATAVDRGWLGLLLRRGPDALGDYKTGYQAIVSAGGWLGIERVDGTEGHEVLVSSQDGSLSSNDELNLRFDAIGADLAFWVWPDDEDMPDFPTLTAFDDTYSEGSVGVWFYESENSAADPSGVFREFRTVVIPEPTFAITMWFGFLLFFTWHRK